MKQYFVPIFEKDGNRLFILYDDFRADNEYDARQIGWGAMLVECVVLGMKFTHDVMELLENIPNRKAELGGFPVAIISGPMFDERAVLNGRKRESS